MSIHLITPMNIPIFIDPNYDEYINSPNTLNHGPTYVEALKKPHNPYTD